MAENPKIRATVQRMIDEGADDATIREFVQKARARIATPGPATPGTTAREIATQQLEPQVRQPGSSARDIASQQLEKSSRSTPTPGSMVGSAPGILSDQPYSVYDESGAAVVPPEGLAYEKQGPIKRAYQSIRGTDPSTQRIVNDVRKEPGIESLRQLDAVTRGVGAGLGGSMLLTGPLRALGLMGEASLPAEVVAGVAPAARVVGPAVEGAAGSALGNAVTAKALDRPVGPAAEEGAYVGGLLGPFAAATAELVSSGYRGVSNLLRRNKQIGTHARAVEAGAYKDPEMQALEAPEPGQTGTPSPELQIRRAADKATDRVVGRIQEIEGQAGQKYQEATNPIGPRTPAEPLTEEVPYTPDPEWRGRLPGRSRGPSFKGAGRTPETIPVEGETFPQEGLAAPINRDALEEALNASRARNTNTRTGQPYNEDIEKRLKKLLDSFGPRTKAVDSDVTFQRPSPMTTDEALNFRRDLKAESAFDSAAPSKEQLTARSAYGDLRGAIRDASPDVIAPADDAFAATKRMTTRAKQIVGVEDEILQQSRPLHPEEAGYELADDFNPAKPEKSWSLPADKETKAATNLARVNDDNIPGVNMNKHLNELRKMDPEFDKALQFIADKKALEATKYGFHGHLPESLHSVKAVVGPALRQNVRALGDDIEQLASGVAEGTSGPGGFAPSLALQPFIKAIAAEKERKRRGLSTLGRGQNAITGPRASD